ncbi:hypothetical protein O3M35_004747 [Rhynocoris fuscipes]|uniref:Large ribosomal subunit protein mL37 n=1 Tax=Rhynocoris fuscipes TaxID=488301 RepID=A0AAW1DMY6_9HEMI
MKRSLILFQQHTGRMFRDKWKVQGKRVLIDTGALKELKLRGIAVEDANDVVRETFEKTKHVELDHFPPKLNEIQPDYHEEPCLNYSDHNVLIGGLDQAKVFTNSCEMDLSLLPFSERLDSASIDSSQNSIIKRLIKTSLLFDATQEKLPIRKDPNRPAFVFPRDFGITDKRKNFLLGRRLLQLCSILNPELKDKRRFIKGPLYFQTALNRDSRNILLSVRADELIASDVYIKSLINKTELTDKPIPDILPLSAFVSLEKIHTYKFEDFYPMNKEIDRSVVHTVLVHFNKTEVTNLYETEVTESQILARSLMKCYAIAIAEARNHYGKDVEDLPEPLTIQCIQTDSKQFYFSIFQLNTTRSSEETNIRNAYWILPALSLFDQCDYIEGIPKLVNYNPQVFHTLLSFYQNC